MSSPADPSGVTNEQIRTALFEYAHAPGKYSVGLREPALLFASIREILQIAAGREPDAERRTDGEKAALRRAACFFTRSALLAPGADHYTVLGLQRNFDASELKDRYRLLMRLTHPDFSGAITGAWPVDAAVRVNLAHDVLSSAVKRREYDARLAAASKAQDPAAAAESHAQIKPHFRPARRRMERTRLKQLAIVCSVAAGCLVLISLFVGRPDAVQLVQRAKPLIPASAVVAVQESSEAQTPPAEPTVTALTRPASQAPAPTPELPRAIPEPPLPAPTHIPPPAAAPVVAAPGAPAPAHAPVIAVPRAPAPAAAPMIAMPRAPTPAPRAIAPAPPPALAAEPPAAKIRFVRTEPAPVAAPPPPVIESRPPAQLIATMPPPPPVLPPTPRPVPVAGVSLAEAQPLLAILLQQLESGRGDRVINMLDREARSKQGAQSLSRQYDSLVDGMQPVRLSHFEFKAEPAEGRLLVTGHIRLLVGEQTIGSSAKQMVLRAEFASRDGAVVMTGLSSAPN